MLKIAIILKRPAFSAVIFCVLLIFFSTIPEIIPPDHTSDFSLTFQHSPETKTVVSEELLDFDFPPRTGTPLEIPAIPRDLERFQLLHSVGFLHQTYFKEKHVQHHNESLRRLFMMFMQYESISRLRFNRGTKRLASQTDIEGLADHILNSLWYREALLRFSSNNDYGFSEERMIRILISIQAAAHYFELPYPALFCLFFQESKFDFLANSPTGAKGVGQLTSIGLRQIQRLRRISTNELKLQSTADYLNQVYTDPQILKWLTNLGFKTNLPEISAIPETIIFTRLTSSFMRKVGKELEKEGQAFGKNIGLLWFLSKRLRRGRILPSRYAQLHKVFATMLEKQYASSAASVYNIETNILLSTMLFNHYYHYRWRYGKKVFKLPSETRVILAAAAYNHGQTGMRRFLNNLRHEFPMLDFEQLSAQKMRSLLTTRRLSRALKSPYYKIREASRHVRKVMQCAVNSS
ncbi:MAG: hypothetical protein H8E38_12120 [SAR324 cluster bacterium]|nr:hypothetical protein [SAR324 cluster bacterium]